MLKRLARHTLLPLTHHPRYTTTQAARSAATAANHYQVMGVERTATPEDIKKAFRERVKALHPDLNAHLSDSQAQAFLRLVEAYEVLGDAEQRRLYDAATDQQLPRVLRTAAAAAAAGQQGRAADGSSSTNYNAGTDLNWRWGLGDWAQQGPAVGVVAAGADAMSSDSLRLSVLSALRRHQRDMEVELHAALMTAFFGPNVDICLGELPPALELDERSDPTLTDDLLHLVHGRELLGVVALPKTLRLDVGTHNPAHLPHTSASGLLEASSLQPLNTPAPHATASSKGDGQLSPGSTAEGDMQHNQQQHMMQGKQQQQQGHSIGSTQHSTQQRDAESQDRQQPQDGAGTAFTTPEPDPDAEISDAEWQQLLQKQHPLLGVYDWRLTPAAAETSSSSSSHHSEEPWQHEGGGAQSVLGAFSAGSGPGLLDVLQPAANGPQGCTQETKVSSFSPHGPGGCSRPDDSCPRRQQPAGQQQGAASQALEENSLGALGGREARNAWQQRHDAIAVAAAAAAAQQAQVEGAAVAGAGGMTQQQEGHTGGPGPAASTCSSRSGESAPTASATSQSALLHHQQHQQQEMSWQQEWHHLDPLAQLHKQQQWQQEWQRHKEQQQQQREHWRQQQEQPGPTQPAQGQQWEHQQQQQQWQRSQRQPRQQGPRLGHRRLWRWLRNPTADWQAADWSFSDESDGVLVLRLHQQDGAVAAVAVRDDRQHNKPIKVYVDGVLLASVLDDVVLQPLTGMLMAVQYRYHTPGVHHCYFYLPAKPGAGSRVLARMQRRWLPPSNTWLFPPRSSAHDRCSWVMEWEGFDVQRTRPGWLHPAVYVLTAAFISYDLEARRINRLKAGRGTVEQLLERVIRHSLQTASRAWSVCKQLWPGR